MKQLSISILMLAFFQENPRAGIQVFDFGLSATRPLALGETPAALKGEAVVSNGRISLRVARNASSAELRSGGIARARLSLPGVSKLDRAALVEHGPAGATLELGAAGATARVQV